MINMMMIIEMRVWQWIGRAGGHNLPSRARASPALLLSAWPGPPHTKVAQGPPHTTVTEVQGPDALHRGPHTKLLSAQGPSHQTAPCTGASPHCNALHRSLTGLCTSGASSDALLPHSTTVGTGQWPFRPTGASYPITEASHYSACLNILWSTINCSRVVRSVVEPQRGQCPIVQSPQPTNQPTNVPHICHSSQSSSSKHHPRLSLLLS